MGWPKIYTEQFLLSKSPFGELTFISTITGIKGTMCKWKCSCGKEILRRPTDIAQGKIKSCGHLQKRTGKNHPRWLGVEEMSGQFWGSIIGHAKDRKLKVLITPKEAWECFLFQNRKCALTGEVLQFDTSWRKGDGNASLDRIDSSKGYVKGNIQWVHKDINMMKKDYSDDYFIKMCKKVVDNLSKKM